MPSLDCSFRKNLGRQYRATRAMSLIRLLPSALACGMSMTCGGAKQKWTEGPWKRHVLYSWKTSFGSQSDLQMHETHSRSFRLFTPSQSLPWQRQLNVSPSAVAKSDRTMATSDSQVKEFVPEHKRLVSDNAGATAQEPIRKHATSAIMKDFRMVTNVLIENEAPKCTISCRCKE